MGPCARCSPPQRTPSPPCQPGDTWAHEVKWDGMRLLADVTDGELRLTSRTEADVTVTFPELAGLATVLADGMLDGEVVAFADGKPDFGALADRMHVRDPRRARSLAERFPVSYVVFDVVRLYGVPLLGRSFDDRRQTLERLELGDGSDACWQVPAIFDDGEALLEATRASGLEGIVSKRRTSTYQPGRRSRDWLKRAHRSSQTAVVGGWRPQTGTTSTLASLLVGPAGRRRRPDVPRQGRCGHRADGVRRPHPPAHAAGERRPRPSAILCRPWTPAARAGCGPSCASRWRTSGYGRAGRLRQPAMRGVRSDVRLEDLRRE